jgi:ribosomal protein S18 acetylase RimI-like enzyme
VTRAAVSVRFFESADTEPVADLLHDMSRHYNGDNASSREVVRRNLIANILGADSDVRIVVAESEAGIVGLAMISILYPAPKEHAQLFMKELYVLSSARSRGVGRQLMAWVARFAAEKNCSRFDWTVDAHNASARAFYDSLGATRVDEKLYYRFSDRALLDLADAAERNDKS